MARAFREAGGRAPRLLVHDAHGAEMIALVTRHGSGLLAAVVPMELSTVSGFGHAETLAALGAGFTAVDVLARHTSDLGDVGARARAGRGDRRAGADPGARADRPRRPAGGPSRGDVRAGRADPLHRHAAAGDARGGEGASAWGGSRSRRPRGRPTARRSSRTPARYASPARRSARPARPATTPTRLCSGSRRTPACNAGSAPTSAPRTPSTLAPRLDLSDAALSQRVLREAAPAACVECRALFRVQSTIGAGGGEARRAARDVRLLGRDAADPHLRRLPREGAVRAAGERPRVVTSDDDRGRRDHSRPAARRPPARRRCVDGAPAAAGLPHRASAARVPRRRASTGLPDGVRGSGRKHGIWTRRDAGAI